MRSYEAEHSGGREVVRERRQARADEAPWSRRWRRGVVFEGVRRAGGGSTRRTMLVMEGSIACRWDREGSCVYFWASAGKVLGLKKECDREGNR